MNPMDNTQKTILVVDDDPYIVDLLTRQLKAKGFRVLATTDPETAFALAEKEKPDLIISDVAMPALDGFTLFRSLKENKVTAGIPLVLLTGSDRVSDVEKGFSSGARAYLLKPFDWETAWPKLQPLLQQAT
jgi:DNA-binding response OmpR family regulator